MDTNDDYKFVDFEHYCLLCKYKKEPETFPKCSECLSYPALKYSSKPVNFEEAEYNNKKGE